jgi:hypothetical protein
LNFFSWTICNSSNKRSCGEFFSFKYW